MLGISQETVLDSYRVSISEDLGNLLRQLRTVRNVSQSELARRLEIAPAQVSQIEAGTYTPSLRVLESILNELDASLCIQTEEGVMVTDSSGLDLPPADETS